MRNAPSAEDITRMYRQMLVVRAVEEQLAVLHRQGKTRGPIHTCIGQEAAGIGATAPLEREDVVTSTHRGHAHFVGKGLDLRRVLAEIFGRVTGYCRGRGGHMLVASAADGLLGGNGIVGGGIPIALGQAFGFQLDGSRRVAVAIFGDGAAQEGTCHEAMNVAGLWKLPMVFFCEHNLYGLTVHARYQSSVPDLHVRAAGYGMPGVMVDGNDLLAVHGAMRDALDRARRGDGPTFVEAKTYRMTGFSTSDMGGYQPEEEMREWAARDPIARTRALLATMLDESSLEAVERAAAEEVEAAFAQAMADPFPDAAELDAPEYAVAEARP